MLLLAVHKEHLLSSSKLSDMMNVHAVRVRKVLSQLRTKVLLLQRRG
jgi:DNA-binding IscR family transcriptional regulator